MALETDAAGGFHVIAKLAGYVTYRRPKRYWTSKETVAAELKAVLEEGACSTPPGWFPTQKELLAAGRTDLLYGVSVRTLRHAFCLCTATQCVNLLSCKHSRQDAVEARHSLAFLFRKFWLFGNLAGIWVVCCPTSGPSLKVGFSRGAVVPHILFHAALALQLHGSGALAQLLGLKVHYRGIRTKRKARRGGRQP